MRRIWGLREPLSALSHALGAGLAIIATLWLVHGSLTHADALRAVGAGVFGISLVSLYLASTLYHGLTLSDAAVIRLKRIDHMMIYAFIAGTYTPVCLAALTGSWRWGLLLVVWALAFTGIACKIFWLHAPRWLTVALYLGLGWLAAIIAPQLWLTLPAAGFIWILAGGLFYTVGAVIYGIKRPNFKMGVWEFHETWHVFVLAGSFCHVFAIGRYVLPLP